MNNWDKLKEVCAKGWDMTNPDSPCSGPLEKNFMLRKWVQGLIENYDIKSITDVGCGDMFWVKELDLSGIEYYGYDWVKQENTSENLKKINAKHRQWRQTDISQRPLHQSDLMICRSVLIHMTNDMAVITLNNLMKSKPKYIIMSTQDLHSNQGRHINVSWPSFSPIDMEKEPFSFGKPLYSFGELHNNQLCQTGFWHVEDSIILTNIK